MILNQIRCCNCKNKIPFSVYRCSLNFCSQCYIQLLLNLIKERNKIHIPIELLGLLFDLNSCSFIQ